MGRLWAGRWRGQDEENDGITQLDWSRACLVLGLASGVVEG